jgi:hypothetical protein
MPRPRKPTKLLEISGAFAKNPARARARENEPLPEGPLGPPPGEWTRGAESNQRCVELLRAWQEIVDQACFGVLTSSDRDLVELTCYLKYKIRRAAAGYGKATSGDFAQLNRNLGQMGLIPSERSRVSGKKKSAEVASEWATVAKRLGKKA